jgi:ankyrin repeat protein
MRCLFQWLQKPDGSGNCPCCRQEPTEHERLVAAPADEDDDDYDSESESETEGVTPLMDAIITGNVAEVARLIADGTDLEARDSDGDTAMVYAVMQPTTEALLLLLDAGAAIDSRGMSGTTPLMRAVEEGQYEAAKILIERGANCAAEDEEEESLVIQAARLDAVDVLRMILERGVGRLGDALHEACRCGSRDCALALLEVGADPNALGSDSCTPLMSAVGGDDPDSGIVDALIAKGADVNATDEEGMNVFMYMTYGEGAPDPDIMAALLDAMAVWKRGSDGRWSQITQTWGHGDAAPPPYTLAEETRAAATQIQAAWRGWQVRRPAHAPTSAEVAAAASLEWLRLQVTVPVAPQLTRMVAVQKTTSLPGGFWDNRFSRVL